MHDKFAPEKPTTERFIATVLDRQVCKKHKAEIGAACYYINGGHASGFYIGVCNARARKAGFNHAISEKSLRLNRFPKKR